MPELFLNIGGIILKIISPYAKSASDSSPTAGLPSIEGLAYAMAVIGLAADVVKIGYATTRLKKLRTCLDILDALLNGLPFRIPLQDLQASVSFLGDIFTAFPRLSDDAWRLLLKILASANGQTILHRFIDALGKFTPANGHSERIVRETRVSLRILRALALERKGLRYWRMRLSSDRVLAGVKNISSCWEVAADALRLLNSLSQIASTETMVPMPTDSWWATLAQITTFYIQNYHRLSSDEAYDAPSMSPWGEWSDPRDFLDEELNALRDTLRTRRHQVPDHPVLGTRKTAAKPGHTAFPTSNILKRTWKPLDLSGGTPVLHSGHYSDNDPYKSSLQLVYQADVTAFDIVLVHAFGSSGLDTWTGLDESRLTVCWPQMWLPRAHGLKQARILLFHYVSPITINYGLWELGERLLAGIYASRLSNGNSIGIANPIILVGHGTGGLLAECAYVVGFQAPSIFGQIIEAISGVVYLDTPRGDDPETFFSSIEKAAKAKNTARDVETSRRFFEAHDIFKTVVPERLVRLRPSYQQVNLYKGPHDEMYGLIAQINVSKS